MADFRHDPSRPVAHPPAEANMAEQVRIARRQRNALAGGLVAVLIAGAIAIALVVTSDDDDREIENVAGTETSDISVAPSGAQTTAQGTVSVTTTPPSVVATSIPNSVSTETPQLSTTTPLAPTTVAAATTTTTAVAVMRPIVAIDGNGDAVIVDPSGTTTLLHDGSDPDDPPPAEGEVIVVDAVAVTDDLSVTLVGLCCEPVPGTVLRYQLPDTSTFVFSFFGHAPAISPDGTKVATDLLSSVSVSDLLLGTEIGTTPEEFLIGSGIGIVWIDNERFVVLTAAPDVARLQSVSLAADNTLQSGPIWSSIGAVDAFETSLAGVGDGVVYIAGLAPSTLTAFDSGTLQPVPTSDVTLPGDPLSAWMQDGELRWIDQGRQLHIGDVIVPGEFVWVR